jgi:hypothetical protein
MKRSSTSAPTARRLFFLALTSAVIGTSVVALGQDRRPEPGAREEAAAPTAGAGDDSAPDAPITGADTAEVTEAGGSKVKLFKFSGLGIDGRLKSPSLLYFLNRLRAEFDRPKLPHRSFMPEMVRSTKNDAFK